MEKIQLFENKKVRTVWDEEKQEWFFSVLDVIEVLTDSKDPTDYFKKMRKREEGLAEFVGTNCPQVEMLTQCLFLLDRPLAITDGNGTGLTASGTETTLYFPFVLNLGSETKYTFTSGQQFAFHVFDSDGKEYTETKKFTRDTDLEPGKLYTVNSTPVPVTP